MATYPIPAWLSPSAALGYGSLYGEAQRAAQSAQLARERMAQESAQAGMEAQARREALAQQMQFRQQALQQEQMRQDQRIAIDQAYKQAEVGLREDALDTANRRIQMQADAASKRYAAGQDYLKRYQQNVLPKEQGGKGMNAQDAAMDASQAVIPYMSADAISKLTSKAAPFQLGSPVPLPGRPGMESIQTGPNRFQIIPGTPSSLTPPITQSVTNNAGDYLGDRVIFPDTGKVEWKPHPSASSKNDDFTKTILDRVAKNKGVTLPGSTKTETAPAARKAEGGYRVGAVYKGGLKYIGGDPGDESSWEKVK